ncbi:MAG TPA: EAL domain-containing protein [Pyrinomonadaceae bacterium]|jgi:diguanylate cyclase (GGDEF)-like protein/PAS domain S-box-containing protein
MATNTKHKARARILIADDEPHVRELLHELLSAAHDCRAVASAEEALAVLREEQFQLVLSDITMPGLSGLDLVPQVRALAPDTVVVMLSGEQNIEHAIRAMRVGAFDYVTKPFAIQHVEAAVARALDYQQLCAVKRYYENFLEEIVRQRTSELHKSNQTLRTLIEAAPLAIFALDDAARLTMWNPAAARIFGWTQREVLGSVLPIVARAEVVPPPAWLAAALRHEPVIDAEARVQRKDGTELDVSIWTGTLADEAGKVIGTVVVMADITERKQAEARINFLAYHDTLTNLPNRMLFEDRLAQALTLAHRHGQMLAVLFIALDRFKKFTDTLGHAAADALLCIAAERLRAQLREGDTVARFHTEEFSLLLSTTSGTEDAAAMARGIQQVLRPPIRVAGQELYVTASIGVGLYPYDGADAQSLLRNAGAALYRAKQQGGNQYQFYTADMNERALQRLAMENSLRRALEREEFVLHYQPQVCGDDGRVVGVEALVRWQHPELGLVPPVEFIPLAEDTGLIEPIGAWVLHTALAQAVRWQARGLPVGRIAVNLSARQFRQPDLAGMVAGLLAETGLRPACLELELTESSIMHDTANAIATLRELKAMGVRVAVDDFGAGYSSLAYLKHLPIDVLKIDRSFIRDMATDADDAAIVMAIITLAHSLKLQVVAEGVETEEHLRFLRLLRCDEMQGYLFSKPLSAADLEQLLARQRAGAKQDLFTLHA